MILELVKLSKFIQALFNSGRITSDWAKFIYNLLDQKNLSSLVSDLFRQSNSIYGYL